MDSNEIKRAAEAIASDVWWRFGGEEEIHEAIDSAFAYDTDSDRSLAHSYAEAWLAPAQGVPSDMEAHRRLYEVDDPGVNWPEVGPELLEALRLCLVALDNTGFGDSQAATEARAAIAKATGKDG